MRLEGKLAVVTGAGMGMGRELALRLAREGCALALCDIDKQALQVVQHECAQLAARAAATSSGIPADGRLVSVHHVDVSRREEVRAFRAAVIAAHETDEVGLLFNNAGIQIQAAFDRMSEDDFDKVMAVNLDGVIAMTRAFWPGLVAAAARPGGAALVNTSSVAALWPQASGTCSPYATSKAAVRGFTEHLAHQARMLAPGLQVVCVHPGAIQTEIVGKNFNIVEVDERLVRSSPLLSAAQRAQFEAADQAGRVRFMRQRAAEAFKLGIGARQAADEIIDGVVAGSTRVMVGWDAVFMDWWIRAFPRAFLWPFGLGDAVFFSTVVGRHLVVPGAAFALALLGWRGLRARL